MKVRILYFAKARDLAGTSEESLELAPGVRSLRDLSRVLIERHPALGAGALERMRIARNESFAELDELCTEGDVIALIPPVAGG